ncbi:type IX secretion system membrane protein, PorP/SprF family [Chitinophaga sp. CF118]|nr:type IX secretion system membrane protein, PorP/SprF family [Chitinophaga sp. CF118]
MRKVILLLLITAGQVKAQQTVQFSQYVFNGLSVNPAYAGYKEHLYINMAYRHQWTGIPGAPRTGGISIDGPRGAGNKVGLGLQAMVDFMGPQQAFSLYGSYAYRIPLDQDGTKRFALGIGIGVTQYSLDGSALIARESGDPTVPTGKVNTLAPDARFGIYYSTPAFYMGISVMDLFSLYTENGYFWKGYNFKTIRKSQHIYLTTGCMLYLSEHLRLKPSLMIKEDFKGPTGVDINAFLQIDHLLWIGGSFRMNPKLWKKELPDQLQITNAASAMVEYYVSEKLRIGYSYDLNINKLAGYQGGSHEISVGISFPSKKSTVINPRYF